MKTKKVFLAIIFVLIISLIFGGIVNSSYALTKEEIAGMSLTRTTPLNLGIVQIRESGYGYMSGTKTVFKVVSYPLTEEASNTNIDWSNSIYCIKGGPGFSVEGNNLAEIQYDIFRDMNGDKTDSYLSKYISLIPTNNYGPVLWLLDNIYLPKNANKVADKLALLQTVEAYDSEMYAEDAQTLLTDDDIEAIQQAAIWHFTNMDDGTGFDVGNTISPYITKTERTPGKYTSIPQTEYTSIGSLETTSNSGKTSKQADDRLIYAGTLYRYLINTAATKTNYTQTTVSAPLSINSNAVSVIEGNNYIVGPFKITKENDTTYTNFVATIKNQDETDVTDYKILDTNKAETTKTIEQLIGENFYIQIPLTNDTISKVKVSITADYKGNSTINLIASSADQEFTTTQPLAIIDRQDNNLKIESSADITKPGPDLALRKFITKVNDVELKDGNGKYLREPVVDVSKLNTIGEDGKLITTAIYNHPKTPVGVQIGDIVTYTIRVYNEGQVDGYAKEVIDHLPPELEFIVNSTVNTQYLWLLDETDTSFRTIKTDYLSKNKNDDKIILAFDGTELHYQDLQVQCKVRSTAVVDKKITNIADITKDSDKDGNEMKDRDSTPGNVVLPTDDNLPAYKDDEINKPYVPGQEDDDDFEKVIIKQFDLALRKFITKVNDMIVSPSREPQVDVTNLNKIVDEKLVTTATYTHPKDPVPVATGDIVTYTIRMYNEGEIDGYVQEVKDDIPEGLEFLPDNALNKEYRWVMYDNDGKVTQDVTKAVEIRTDYLSKQQEKTSKDNLILAYDETTMTTLAYKDVKVNFKVVEPNTSSNIITNTAEITNDADGDGNDVPDRDSTPDNNIPTEDDIDVDHVKLTYFDLALRKFITEVEGNVVSPSREPVVDISKINTLDEEGKLITTATYTHPKDPVDVVTRNIVTYTIRVYNEGTRDGYAKEVKDDIPEGLEFLPDNELNKQYRWLMYDKEGNVTEDITKAVDIRTDYLSKDQEKTSGANLINAFDSTKGLSTVEPLNPDYKDVKVNFKVTEPETSDRILINTAQISNDSDENGNDVIDRDSTPDNNKPGEDDIDIDKVKVKYFDLSLKKWVTQAIVTENGKTTVQETGHTGDENPEPIVKVELYRKNINKVTVKFRYKIKVTNEGEIAGYAKEVTDYVPKGLKFVQADNPDWYIRDNDESKIATKKLENTLLKPKESATVEVVLTWINGNDNMGVMTNIAEISKDYNDSHTPDIDSTPDNKVPGEDDIDDAPVLLGVATGSVPTYLGLVGAILITITGGVILIKKYVIG